jgi:hypothetical protein
MKLVVPLVLIAATIVLCAALRNWVIFFTLLK